MNIYTKAIGMVAFIAALFSSVGAFMPASLAPMQGTTTGWSNSSVVVTTPLNISVVNPVFNDTGAIVQPITASANATNTTPAVTITKTLDNTNGQTFGWIASTDPTGLGIRSNMDAGCTMYISIGGFEVYFQPYGWSC